MSLGPNHSADARDMYSVFVVSSRETPLSKPVLEQVTASCSDLEGLAQRSWCGGDNGIVLFNSENAKVHVSVNNCRARTNHELKLKLLPTDKGPFEIVDRESNIAWQLAYSVTPMPGIFSRTKVMTIMPRYCIVNCTGEALLIRQKGAASVLIVDPFTSRGWHKTDAAGSTEVQCRSVSTHWSKGALDINELGTSEFLLACVKADARDTISHVVMNVDVKMARDDEHCAVSITFWRSDLDLGSPLSVRNDSSQPLYARQADVVYKTTESANLYQLVVPPGQCMPFGWADPMGKKLVEVSIGGALGEPATKFKTLPFTACADTTSLPCNGTQGGEAVATITTRVGGVVLSVSDASNEKDAVSVAATSKAEDDTNESAATTGGGESTKAPMSLWLSLQLAYVGVSIIADKPTRREFLSLYAGNVDVVYGSVPSANMQSVEMKVEELQIDNYSETAVYPVLLRRVRRKGHKQQGKEKDKQVGKQQGAQEEGKPEDKQESPETMPFFQFALIREIIPGNPPSVKFRYITMRLIEFALEVDSSTVELLLTDVLNEFHVTSPSEALARAKPQEWIAEYNGRILSPIHRKQLVDIFQSHMSAKAPKIHFEHIVLHPMKIALTFLPTKAPARDERTTSIGTAVMDILTSMAAVELMEIRLNSFIVKDAIESFGTLQTRVTNKLYQDLMHQLAQIAGSLTVLGSPAGLVRNVGGGVQNFFYEPYQGLVQSPQDFLIGIRRGTSSLLTGVLGGVLNSTVNIVGSATSGLAYLTGDTDYVQQRAQERHRAKESARHQGVVGGLKQGGKEVLSGFASGVTGIFTAPVEQVKKDGAVGIFAGIGKGVAGVSVKPILGLTDGLTTIVSSVMSEVNDDAFSLQTRPPRAFARHIADPSVLVLCPLDVASASAQAYVMKKAAKHDRKDRYVANFSITKTSHLILSETFVYVLTDGSKDWKCRWTDISECALRGAVIELFMHQDTSNQIPTVIRCTDDSAARKCYELFEKNAHRLSNPHGVRPPEALQREISGSDSTTASTRDSYVFGQANEKDVRHKDLSEGDILQEMESGLRDVDTTEDKAMWCDIDTIVWASLFQWVSNHTGAEASRSLALILLNSSSRSLQLTGFKLKQGKSVEIVGTSLYERQEKILKPRGCVVIFVTAAPPNLDDSGHILLDIESNACDLTVATRPNKTTGKGKEGFECDFLEKSSAEWWSKYVVKLY